MSNVARTIGRMFTKKRQRSQAKEEDPDEDSGVVDESTAVSVVRVSSKKRFRRPVDS